MSISRELEAPNALLAIGMALAAGGMQADKDYQDGVYRDRHDGTWRVRDAKAASMEVFP